jgi:hypothetical protein
LDSFHCYAGPSAKTHKARVHDGGEACDLSCARGSCSPHARERICGVLCGILQAGIRYAFAPLPPLVIIAIWPRATQPDPLRGPAHSGLHDRGPAHSGLHDTM